ncbi:U1-like protein [Lissonota sp. PSUC_FEM 10030012]|nr:U1-like protein [Lissonota sp. PSUC_FEM 10030012]
MFTDDDRKMVLNAVYVKVQNDINEGKYAYEKKSKRENLFELKSEEYRNVLVNNVKEESKALIPTQRKILSLTKEGCDYYSCPSIVFAKNRGKAFEFTDLKPEELTQENLNTSPYCIEKYKALIHAKQDKNFKNPYDESGYLYWQKLSDGSLGCTHEDERFANYLLYPNRRGTGDIDGVTNVPPMKLYDDFQFDMTEPYCAAKVVSYKPASSPTAHDDDCYLSISQTVGEAIFGKFYREFFVPEDWQFLLPPVSPYPRPR